MTEVRVGDPSTTADTLAAAVAFVKRHQWSVIPLVRNAKVPSIKWEEYQRRRATAEELEGWFADGDANIGVVTGKLSGIVVIDIDGPKGEESLARFEVPRTVTVKTPRGRHLYFKHPGGGVVVRNGASIMPGVDVRGDGGYVVAPPSRINGAAYACIEGGEIAPLPEWFWAINERSKEKKKKERADPGETLTEGERNEILFLIASTWRGKGWPVEAIEVALLAENQKRCRPPLPDDEVRRIAKSVGRYPPGETEEEDKGEGEEFAGPRPKPPRTGTIKSLTFEELMADVGETSFVIEDLVADGQVVTIVGEEGAGKTVTFAGQIAAEMIAGGPALGELAVPFPVAAVLIVDTEQTKRDIQIAMDIVHGMGLSTDGIRWAKDALGVNFDDPNDAGRMTAEVRAFRPDVVIIDTGTSGVSDPLDDPPVSALFDVLAGWIENEGVRGVIVNLQPRKRGGGEEGKKRGPRRGDDVYGSRQWKGRSSALMLFGGGKLTWDPRYGWKQRGSYMQTRYGEGWVEIERREGAPSVIRGAMSEEEQAARWREAEAERWDQVLKIVIEEPGKWSLSSLLEDRLKLPSGERPVWERVVKGLIEERLIVKLGQYNKLSPTPKAQEEQERAEGHSSQSSQSS